MNYREITLFSVKDVAAIIPHFNRLVESVKNMPCKLEHGVYESQENLNKGYNYVLKITSSNNSETSNVLFQKEYKLLLEEIIPALGKEEILTFVYKPSQQLINENLQETPKINHIVFFPFSANCLDKTIAEVFSKLKELFPKVEGITGFCYGERLNSPHVAREYVFEMQFLNLAARDKYLTQREHVEVAEFIIPLLENGKASVIAFDYRLPIAKRDEQHNLTAQGLFSTPINSASRMPEPQGTDESQIQGYRS